MKLSLFIAIVLAIPAASFAADDNWSSYVTDMQTGSVKSREIVRKAADQAFGQRNINATTGDSKLIRNINTISNASLGIFRNRCVPAPDNIMLVALVDRHINSFAANEQWQSGAKNTLYKMINPWIQYGHISEHASMQDLKMDSGDYDSDLDFIWRTYTLIKLKSSPDQSDYLNFMFLSQPQNKGALGSFYAEQMNNANRAANGIYPGSNISCQTGSGRLQIAQSTYDFNGWQLIEHIAVVSPYQLQWSMGGAGVFLKISNGDMMSSHIRAQFRETSSGEYKVEILSANIGVAVDRSTSKSDKNIKYVQGTRDDTANTVHLNKYYQSNWLNSGPGAKDGVCRQVGTGSDKCNIIGFFSQLMTDRAFASTIYEQKL